MTQTNQPEKKHNGALKEDSLDEIISWGSPVATASSTSQEELFSSNKTLDFLDEDEDTFINEGFCKTNESKEEHIFNGYASNLDLGDEEPSQHETSDQKKELNSSKDLCARYCDEDSGHNRDDICYGDNSAVLGQDNSSESDQYKTNDKISVQDSWRSSSNVAIPDRINNSDDRIFGDQENHSEASNQETETAVCPHQAEAGPSHPPECVLSNENCNSHANPVVSLKDILGDEEEESSEDLFGKKKFSEQLFSENIDGHSLSSTKDSDVMHNIDSAKEGNHDFDGEEQKLASNEPEHIPDGTHYEPCSSENPSLAGDAAFMDPYSSGSNEALDTMPPSSEDAGHSDTVDTISRSFNAGLKRHDNIENVGLCLSSHGVEKASIHKSSGSSTLGKFKLHHPVIKSCGESLLIYVRVSTRRCFSDKVIERDVATLQLHRPVIPTISEDSFRDKTVFRVLAVKNLMNDRSKISSLLNIEEKDIFDSDISVVIDKNFLNDSITKDRKILNSAKSIFEFIRCSNENSKNVLKFKMGLASSKGLMFEPGNLYQIASSGDKHLVRSFILSQKNIMLFFVLFYKLGLAEFEDYKDIFFNNIYHQYILTKLGIWKSPTVKQSKNTWSIMNVVDFGISKILSIDQEQRKEKHATLDSLISEKKLLEQSTGEGDGLKIDHLKTSESSEPGDVQRPRQNDASSLEAGLSSHTDCPKQEDSCFLNSGVSVPSTAKTAPGELREATLAVKASSSGTQDSFSDISEGYAPKGTLTLFDDSDDDFEIFGLSSKENSSKDIQGTTKSDPVDEHQGNNALHIDPTAESTQSTESVEVTNAISDTSGGTKASLPVDHVSGEDKASLGPTSRQDVSDISDDKCKSENMIYKASLASKSSSDLEQESPTYKKKFSKSFADIFTLEGNGAAPSNLDVSSYVPKTEERDQPLMQSCDESDSKSSVISSLFGFFKKKQPESSSVHKDDPYMNRFNMPLKAEIKVPEKERKVVHSFYANKKQAEDLEIPGFKQSKR